MLVTWSNNSIQRTVHTRSRKPNPLIHYSPQHCLQCPITEHSQYSTPECHNHGRQKLNHTPAHFNLLTFRWYMCQQNHRELNCNKQSANVMYRNTSVVVSRLIFEIASPCLTTSPRSPLLNIKTAVSFPTTSNHLFLTKLTTTRKFRYTALNILIL